MSRLDKEKWKSSIFAMNGRVFQQARTTDYANGRVQIIGLERIRILTELRKLYKKEKHTSWVDKKASRRTSTFPAHSKL